MARYELAGAGPTNHSVAFLREEVLLGIEVGHSVVDLRDILVGKGIILRHSFFQVLIIAWSCKTSV